MSRYGWLKPWVLGAVIAAIAVVGVVNFAAVSYGAERPWLLALDLVVDLAMLAGAIAAVIWLGMNQEAQAERLRAAVHESQARVAAVVDSAMDAIITIDGGQRIVLFNRAAETVFRCRREDVLGSKIERFIPARFRDAHHAHIEQFGRTGITNRRMGDVSVLWGLRADGEEFPIEVSISQTREGGERYYTAVLRDVTRRKEYEDALKRQQAELRELSARVLEAREEEKTLIARELHDELGQLLTALKMDLAWLRERLPAADAGLGAKGAQMDALLDQTVASVRRISAELRPLMLDDLGLHDAIAWLVEDFSARSGVECRLESPADSALEGVDRSVATTLYRVLQESLTNIARHARAKHAWVVLDAGGSMLQLEIEDDGRGIESEDLAQPRSLGLKGMRERVLYLGGMVEIGRAPRGGTRVRVRVPRLPEHGSAR
jgi:two-component system sensor kinase